MLYRSNRERILFIVLAIVWVILILNISNALAEPICDTDTGSPCCESGEFEWVGEGNCTSDCWDHIDETYENPWQYTGDDDPANWGGFICLEESPPPPPDNPFADGRCWFDNYFDVRTYHPTHPDADRIANPGGWTVGAACMGGNYNIDKIVFENSDEAAIKHITEIIVNQSQNNGCYLWDSKLLCDWTIRYGSHWYVGDTMHVAAYDDQGQDDVLIAEMTLNLPTTPARPPFCEIKKMSILKSGEIKMRFTAPYDLRDNHIRVRIFSEDGNSLEHQIKITPPYTRNGKPDELEILIPAEYHGRLARIEYRVFDDGYMSRGLTMFKLPEIE